MRRSMSAGLVVVTFAATAAAMYAQDGPTAADSQSPGYLSRATAVLVDVVVRDQEGRPVLDLKPEDFDVSEDGVVQQLASFTLVSRGTGIGIAVRMRNSDNTTIVTPSGSGSSSEVPHEAPPVIALVFDALSADGLQLSQQAALRSIGMSGETPAHFGVFATEPAVRMVQGFTNDPALLRRAVQTVASSAVDAKDTRAERVDVLRRRMAELEAKGLTTSVSFAQGGSANDASRVGQTEQQMRLIQGEMRMLQSFNDLDRDHRGYGTTNSLLAVFQAMALLPGRKAVVFFSEGLPASPVLQGRLQSLIESANRVNITVYAVDASGLRVKSGTDETRKELEAAADERLRQATSGVDYSDGPLTRVIERAEDLLRYNNEGGLESLSDGTGGFLVRGTNDLSSAFKRIDEDMRFHYLLTYSPTNDLLDGRFRTIAVKLRRPRVSVYARKGYRAINAPVGLSVLTYEGPALALLDAAPLPNAFPSQASAFVFPEPDRPGLSPIIVRVTTDHLQFGVDQKKSAYTAQAVVVIRIRDGSGQVVQKMSQQYVLTGDVKELDGARKGELLFYREPELGPGYYQVESMVYDAIAEKGSGRISTLVVPGSESTRLKMSSLVLIARTEKTTGGSSPELSGKHPPFYYDNVLLYPNVGEALTRGRDDALSFYFVVYPVPGRCVCSANISLWRNGKSLAEATRQLPNGQGLRVPHVGNVPIKSLPPGTYELRVTVTDNEDQQSRAAFFTVALQAGS